MTTQLARSLCYVLTLLIALPLFAGCTIAKYRELDKESEELQQQQKELLESLQRDKPAMPDSSRILIEKKDHWLHEISPADYSAGDFRSVLQSIFEGMPITYHIGIPTSYNPLVTAPPRANTNRDHLDALALQTNLGWTLTDGVVAIHPNMTRTYAIPIYGAYTTDNSIEQEIAITHDNLSLDTAASGDFTNEITGTVSPYQELAALVTATTEAQACEEDSSTAPEILVNDPVIAPKPCYAVSGSGNLLILNARPRQHAHFQTAYDQWYAQVSAQVNIKLKIMLLDITDLAQQNLDFSLLRSAALTEINKNSIILETNNQALVNFDTSANGITFSFNDSERYRGSQILIQALNQLGRTYIVDDKDVTARNNQPVSLFSELVTPYLESVSIQATSQGNLSVTTPTFKISQTVTGQAINIVPTITGDLVSVRIVINERALGPTQVFDFSAQGAILKSEVPTTSGTSVTFNRTLGNHQIALLSSTNRITLEMDNASNDFLPVVGDLRSAQKRTYTTLYMIETNILQ